MRECLCHSLFADWIEENVDLKKAVDKKGKRVQHTFPLTDSLEEGKPKNKKRKQSQ